MSRPPGNLLDLSAPVLHVWDAGETHAVAHWLRWWQASSEREVFAHPAYVRLYAAADGVRSRAVCLGREAQGVRILYPFVLRDLSVLDAWSPNLGSLTDLTTPYGYGGPLVWGDGDRSLALAEFWSAFDDWTAAHGVVSEFVRFSLFSEARESFPGQVVKRLDNVIRPLDLPAVAIERDIALNKRKNVRRARRLGVTVEFDTTGERFEEFLSVYEHTMARNDAGPSYYYPRAHYDQLHRLLAGHFVYAFAMCEGRAVAAELVLLSADRAYSFLGGTVREAFPLRPTDLLKYEVIWWARDAGKRLLVLGGGHHGEDGIYQFKRDFSPSHSLPFHIGLRTHCSEAYERLVAGRRQVAERHGTIWEPRPQYFPLYRA